jgi:RNA polymerase sigma factor (TIGR02999 family)
VSTPDNVTALLKALQEGRPDAYEQLFGCVYDELRRIARAQLRRLRPGQTLDTTSLVHEVYLRLVDQTRTRWEDRTHFFAVSALAMRQILVNYARQRAALKRGGGWQRAAFDEASLVPEERAEVLLDLDDALTRLALYDERLSRVVEYRFFGGLTEEEIAAVLGVTERTVRRDWNKARALLTSFLEDGE